MGTLLGPSIIFRNADVGAGSADGRDRRQQGKPARHLIFDAGRRIALTVGDDFDEQLAGEVLTGRKRGFLAGGDSKQAYGRPVGVATLPDGSLLVADDAADKIWRVSAAVN